MASTTEFLFQRRKALAHRRISMTLKRNRTGNDDELASEPPQNQAKLVNNFEADSAVPLRQSLSAQRSAAVINQVKIGDFLESCYYCKKKISAGAEVFMYRDFCAFCSVECRDNQISLDKTSGNTNKKEVL